MNLFLENGSVIAGTSFGANIESEGEVVFTTGMTGYLEILTDPSYYGQIVVFTYPLIGNYGVFPREISHFSKDANTDIDAVYESSKIWVRGVILAEHSENFSHGKANGNFADWLRENNIPALSGIDTRALTQVIREHGVLLGKLGKTKPAKFEDKLHGRFVPEVSPKKIQILEPLKPCGKTIAFMDCGAKNGIFRNFLKRGVRVIRLPFDANPFTLKQKFDGIFFSNGPGDPAPIHETIAIAREAIQRNTPLFGICLGNQILALAAGGKTRKMKYGHRGANQPVQDIKSEKCFITTQNHGYEVEEKTLPKEFEPWMRNLNDGSNEGIRHRSKPFFSVQFHPEACAGPEDTQFLFDEFIDQL